MRMRLCLAALALLPAHRTSSPATPPEKVKICMISFGDDIENATGGGIGVNWDTRVRDDCSTFPCNVVTIDAHEQDFVWGWTVGGGIERMIGCHWSIKAEYLYYTLDDQNFSAHGFIDTRDLSDFRFEAHDQGHIVRAGLNYKF